MTSSGQLTEKYKRPFPNYQTSRANWSIPFLRQTAVPLTTGRGSDYRGCSPYLGWRWSGGGFMTAVVEIVCRPSIGRRWAGTRPAPTVEHWAGTRPAPTVERWAGTRPAPTVGQAQDLPLQWSIGQAQDLPLQWSVGQAQGLPLQWSVGQAQACPYSGARAGTRPGNTGRCLNRSNCPRRSGTRRGALRGESPRTREGRRPDRPKLQWSVISSQWSEATAVAMLGEAYWL